MNFRRTKTWLALIALAIFTNLTHSEEDEKFPITISVSDHEFTKTSQAEYTLMGFLKLFDAALYRESNYDLSTFPKQGGYGLVFDYAQNFNKKQLIQAANEVLSELYTDDQIQSIKADIKRINAAYRNVKEGDQYAIFFKPGAGTSLLLNGKKQVTIENPKFANIYFDIWLSDHPKSVSLRDQLLNQ